MAPRSAAVTCKVTCRVVLIRKGPEPIPRPLPDGFDDLAAHNLLTFKSHQEALDGWAMWELIGHFVNYRKQSSPSLQNLLDDWERRLLGVARDWGVSLPDSAVSSEGLYD